MHKIYKYELTLDGGKLMLPWNSVMRSFQVQDNKLIIWAEFHVGNEPTFTERSFVIIYTGESFIEDGKVYIGTVQHAGLVLHLYEQL